MELQQEECRRASAVIEAAQGATGLHDFLELTLAALDEYLGFDQGVVMLSVANGDLPGDRAYTGVAHRFQEYVLEEYFERWAESDPLTSAPALAAYRRSGYVDLADIAPGTRGSGRRHIDDYLRRNRMTSQLSIRLPAGFTEGYLTVVGPDEYSIRDLLALRELIGPLTEAMRAHLPCGLRGVLSMREAQVAELVSVGFTNLQIAGVLHVEEDTIKKHVSHAMAKVGVAGRTPLAVAWVTGTRLDVPAPGRLA